ncbi:alkyl hydroperoxide reductase protein F [Klebsiella pneumoniae]|uniref:Alkyl hydroperoxide reductase protein F n=1 Tax=Klebsiella pneumoniae TaxID=573 RepID=A0A2X3ELR3_KLEPN|nr:alkyl hydroperoxide reductase protein F [Klebsiella pneumoniae]
MLDTNMKTQLKAYLEKLTKPVELIATLDDSAKSAEIKELLAEIAELSDKVTFKEDNTLAVRKPSFLITNPGSDQGRVLRARRWATIYLAGAGAAVDRRSSVERGPVAAGADPRY